MVSLLFSFLPLVCFRLNSHCLEVVFLLLSFRFPFYFSSSKVPLSIPGSPCLGPDLHSPGVHPCGVTPSTVPSPRLPLRLFHPCLPCFPFCGGFLLLVIPGQAVCFSAFLLRKLGNNSARRPGRDRRSLQTCRQKGWFVACFLFFYLNFG